MTDTIVSMFVTLDGVMQGPGGDPGHPHGGWVFDFMGPEQLSCTLDEGRHAQSLLIGRVTDQSFAGRRTFVRTLSEHDLVRCTG